MQNKITSQTQDCHVQTPTISRGARIKSFVWHLFQMIVAMEIGMTLYHAVFVNLLATASYKAFVLINPLFDYWMMTAAMTLPMIALMRYHQHDWNYCGGMTAAMLAPIVLLTALALIGLIPLPVLKSSGMTLMILGMALYMFLRREYLTKERERASW